MKKMNELSIFPNDNDMCANSESTIVVVRPIGEKVVVHESPGKYYNDY